MTEPTIPPKRKRARRTFTLTDETYEQITLLAEGYDLSRSRFLEHLVARAELVLTWQQPEPEPAPLQPPWWQRWLPWRRRPLQQLAQAVPERPLVIVDAEAAPRL